MYFTVARIKVNFEDLVRTIKYCHEFLINDFTNRHLIAELITEMSFLLQNIKLILKMVTTT